MSRGTWHDRIDSARVSGGFDAEDYNDVQDWERCAAGEALSEAGLDPDEVLGFGAIGPTTAKIRELGMDFAEAVDNDDTDTAHRLLHEIESEVEFITPYFAEDED